MKRLPYLMVMLFLVVPLRASPPIGAVVQSWHYDPNTNMVTAQIVNTSHKDITAFSITITETYADGRVEKHELMEELVGKIIAAKELQGTAGEELFHKMYGDGAFHPGTVWDEKSPVQPGLKDYQAVIDVVAYSDGTADATNDAALERIIDERKVAVASRKMVTEFIKTALADPNDPDPCTTATGKMQAQAAARKGLHTKMDINPMLLELTASELKTVCSRNVNKRDALKQFGDREDAKIPILSVHAALTKNGDPQ